MCRDVLSFVNVEVGKCNEHTNDEEADGMMKDDTGNCKTFTLDFIFRACRLIHFIVQNRIHYKIDWIGYECIVR